MFCYNLRSPVTATPRNLVHESNRANALDAHGKQIGNWYRARADYGAYPHVFRVQVFDPDPANYTNWVSPGYGPDQWTYGLEYDGENMWAVWSGNIPLMGGEVMFGFDNPNPPTWSAWELGSYSSEDFSDYSDGYGYRVHVPVASSPVEDVGWATIKALFR